MLSRRRVSLAVLGIAGVIGVMGSACGSRAGRARDVAGDRRPHEALDAGDEGGLSVPEPPQVTAPTNQGPAKTRVFVRASSRALAIDATNLYYGDSEDDGIYAKPKAGGDAVRLARRAPVTGAIALEPDALTWIASPGDAVLRVALHGGAQPTTLRDRGIFSDVAAAAGEVFITEAIGAGGALLRVTGPTAARLASFEGAPRAVMTDATHAYVITPTKILRTPHVRGELETLATGTGFASPQMDDAFLYLVALVAEGESSHVVVRVPKTGGPPTTIARDVRDAPIEVEGADVLFFDAVRQQVRSVRKTGGPARVLVEDDVLATAGAIVADASTIFVATGTRESAAILAMPRR